MKDESDGSDSTGEFKKTEEQKTVWRELKESVEKKGQSSTRQRNICQDEVEVCSGWQASKERPQ
jgi:hypothetical protein